MSYSWNFEEHRQI